MLYACNIPYKASLIARELFALQDGDFVPHLSLATQSAIDTTEPHWDQLRNLHYYVAHREGLFHTELQKAAKALDLAYDEILPNATLGDQSMMKVLAEAHVKRVAAFVELPPVDASRWARQGALRTVVG